MVSIQAVMASVTILAVCGVLLDGVIGDERLRAWRGRLRDVVIKMNSTGTRGLSRDVNELYSRLFDAIYGARFFSKRRVVASIISTTASLVALTLMFGYEHTIWPELLETVLDEDEGGIRWLIVLVPVVFNFVPDFLSLQETRLVLRWAAGRGLFAILILILVDLVLTTAIFAIAIMSWFALFELADGVPPYGLFELLSTNLRKLSSFQLWFDPKGGALLFYLTTLVTSVFWILFCITFLGAWALHRPMRPLANFLYRAIAESSRPVAATTSMLIALILIGYAILRLVAS